MKTETKSVGTGATAKTGRAKSPMLWALIFLGVVLSILFYKSFDPDFVHFSNDGPFGAMVAEFNRMPHVMTGIWRDQNWLGNEELSPSPAVTTAMRLVMSPKVYAQFLPPATLLIVGLCACFCFRKLGFAPVACVLGALAAGLNSDFLSTSCWGVASQIVGFGANYVALGLLSGKSSKRNWVRVVLAGMAVGIGIMEAYDIGAIFSLFVAAYVLYRAVFMSEEAVPKRVGKGVLKIALVAIFAALISAHSLTTLVGTQLKGIVGMQESVQSKAQRWDQATEWSVPKKEILQVLVPGIFGYRNEWHMYEAQQPEEDQYWGSIGEGPGLPRLIGTGFYGGVAVVVIAIWAALQAFRREGSPYTLLQRKAIWFWTGALLLSAVMAFGKWAPLYQFFYALPYASTIRNPAKFMHVFSFVLVILFAYGMQGLWIGYMKNGVSRADGLVGQFKKWLAKAAGFEKKFFFGLLIAVGVALLSWLIYFSSEERLTNYIKSVSIKPELAAKVAAYSETSVGWFILFLLITIALLALIFSGQFSGSRWKTGAFLLGTLLVVDLGRAGAHWIVYWNVPYKYASDPIIQFLADKPYEHRVSELPIQALSDQDALLHNAYGSDWKQQLFPYYNIQCAEIIQEPRVAIDKEQFMIALAPTNLQNIFRYWELSNTRYILGPLGGPDGTLLSHIDPSGRHFKVLKTWNFVPKGPVPSVWAADYKAEEDPNGQLVVMEFTDALPRAKLFSNWVVNTNDAATLQMLGSPEFDPHTTLLVSDAKVGNPLPANLNQNAGDVQITAYRSKRMELTADVKVPAILFLSERYNPKWQVDVDGKAAELLRCDFIMRGIYLTAGKHTIVLRFVAPQGTLYFSLAVIVVGLALSCWLTFTNKEEDYIAPDSAVTPPKD